MLLESTMKNAKEEHQLMVKPQIYGPKPQQCLAQQTVLGQ